MKKKNKAHNINIVFNSEIHNQSTILNSCNSYNKFHKNK